MQIKTAQVQTLTDARYFSSKGVDILIFNFDPQSERYLAPQEAQQIIKWLSGPKVYGHFGGSSPAQIRETTMILGLDGFIVNYDAVTEDYLSIDLPKMIAITLSDYYVFTDLQKIVNGLAHVATAFLFDIDKHFGSWGNFIAHGPLTVSQLQALSKEANILYAGKFTATDLSTSVAAVQPYGICLIPPVEDKLGEKDFSDYDGLFETLEDEG
ncbi:MAG: hypothetical protein SFW35_14010 [Chitinophagales bacterium]|nr:hypothetical protein [Chitinophagales bacterium]